MPIDTEKDYTGIKRLRMGEWSAEGEMKETKDKAILTWIKKYKKTAVLCGGLVILIVVPLVVYGLSEVSFLPVTGGNDWAGFWGGYIGAIIGGLITLFVMKYTIQSENAKSERQEKIQYFNELIKTSADFFEAASNTAAKMTRCMSRYSNEKYEQVLAQINNGARISIILELMLESRKSEYDLSQYIEALDCLMDKVNVAIDEFEEIVQDIFSDEDKINKLNSELIEIMQDIEYGKEVFEDTVKRNLYGL